MGASALGAEAIGTTDVAGVSYSSVRDDTRLRYGLDVIAANVIDVVRSAGGWLYDRVAAGWEVNVLLPHRDHDERALQILGVRPVDLQEGLNTGPGRIGLAASADVFAADARVREALRRALEHSLTEVTVWGDGWPVQIGRATTVVQYRLSAAARMFKAQALTAVGDAGHGVALTETFRTDLGTCLPVESDLVPLAARTRA